MKNEILKKHEDFILLDWFRHDIPNSRTRRTRLGLLRLLGTRSSLLSLRRLALKKLVSVHNLGRRGGGPSIRAFQRGCVRGDLRRPSEKKPWDKKDRRDKQGKHANKKISNEHGCVFTCLLPFAELYSNLPLIF